MKIGELNKALVKSVSGDKTPCGCLVVVAGFVLTMFLITLLGIYHAFQHGILLGIGAVVLSESATPLVEIFNWFTERDLWAQLAQLLGEGKSA